MFVWSFTAGVAVSGLVWGVWHFWVAKRRDRTSAALEQPAGLQLQELAQLTGELAHEIKNPLSTLKLNLRLVQEQLEEVPSVEPQIRRARNKLIIIQEEADRLDKLLTGFLGYVRQDDCQWRYVDMRELVDTVVDFYQAQAQSHQITLRHSSAPEPMIVRVDVAQFKQALLNLFINAQQAMPKGGNLLVSTRTENGRARLQISDTGCGIPADKLPRLFTPYFSTRRRGTGLGLATVKKIVARFAGDISVDSVPDQGTSFTICLPLHGGPIQTQEDPS